MADRQDKTITVRPHWILRVKTKKLLPQAVSHWCHRHWGSRMTRISCLHCIHRQRADGADARQVNVFHRRLHGNRCCYAHCKILSLIQTRRSRATRTGSIGVAHLLGTGGQPGPQTMQNGAAISIAKSQASRRRVRRRTRGTRSADCGICLWRGRRFSAVSERGQWRRLPG